jgi:hypothetical protein
LLYPLLGVPLSASDLTGVLTGCPSVGGGIRGHALGPDRFRVLVVDVLPAELLFRRDDDAPFGWRLFAMGRITAGSTLHWRADYGRVFRSGFRDVRVRSQEWNGVMGRQFDVSFSWRRLALDTTLDPELFVPETPARRPVS